MRSEEKMKKKSLEVKLTKRNDKLLHEVAKKCGLKPETVLGSILKNEVNIAWYAMSKRLKLFRRLKIVPTVEQLLGFRISRI